MTQEHEHISSVYDAELEQLGRLLAQMGGLAETQLDAALDVVMRRDSEQAVKIREDDRKIDSLEKDVEGLVVRMLALRQPVANDLRVVVSTLKIASDLERVGDYAKNIAKRAIALSQLPATPSTVMIGRLGKLVQQLLKDVLDAYLQRDVEKAVAVWEFDAEVDALYTAVFRELLTYMMEDPRNITACTHLLFIAKNLERIGDHATNIAETLQFQVTGKGFEERRPKDDASNYAVVEPKGK